MQPRGKKLARMPHRIPCCFSTGFSTAQAAAQSGPEEEAFVPQCLSVHLSAVFRDSDPLTLGYHGQDVKPLCFWTSLFLSLNRFVVVVCLLLHHPKGKQRGSDVHMKFTSHVLTLLPSWTLALDYWQQEAIQFWVKMRTGDLPELHSMLPAG